MKKLLTLFIVLFTIGALDGCKSEEEKIAEQKQQQDRKDYSNHTGAASTWVPPKLGAPKQEKDSKP